MKIHLIALFFSSLLFLSFGHELRELRERNLKEEKVKCQLPANLIEEIGSYKDKADQIIDVILNGKFKGHAYNELGLFVDKFGHRMSGSESLEKSIDYMLERMEKLNFDNVHGENASVPHWTRGEEVLQMLKPRFKNMTLLGLGRTVGTPDTGFTVEAIVVRNFTQLDDPTLNVAGKIVVYNQDYTEYGESVAYRNDGAVRAAQKGAIAALIRSIAPFSLDTPHTGNQYYQENIAPKIPVACITQEDAELLWRLQEKGETIEVHLKMLDENHPNVISRNAIGELKGREKEDEVVVVSGHIDSWDVGQGAMDDGGGVIISTEAITVLKDLNFIPKRTIRAILWTAEEFGLVGAIQYANEHENELHKMSAAFESDAGTFLPLGLDFAGSDNAGCIIQEILNKLLHPLNATEFANFTTVSTDIRHLQVRGVPGLSLNNDRTEYFWYHHTEADTLTMQDSREMDLGLAVWTIASYVVADLSIMLPRNGSDWLVPDIPDDDDASSTITFSLFTLIICIIMSIKLK